MHASDRLVGGCWDELCHIRQAVAYLVLHAERDMTLRVRARTGFHASAVSRSNATHAEVGSTVRQRPASCTANPLGTVRPLVLQW